MYVGWYVQCMYNEGAHTHAVFHTFLRWQGKGHDALGAGK